MHYHFLLLLLWQEEAFSRADAILNEIVFASLCLPHSIGSLIVLTLIFKFFDLSNFFASGWVTMSKLRVRRTKLTSTQKDKNLYLSLWRYGGKILFFEFFKELLALNQNSKKWTTQSSYKLIFSYNICLDRAKWYPYIYESKVFN